MSANLNGSADGERVSTTLAQRVFDGFRAVVARHPAVALFGALCAVVAWLRRPPILGGRLRETIGWHVTLSCAQVRRTPDPK